MRHLARAAGLLLAIAGCDGDLVSPGSSDGPPAARADAPPGPGADAPAGPAADAPAVAPDGPTCGDATCAPGEVCQDGECVCPPQARAPVDDPPAAASWRHGGGHGYPDLVDPDRCRTARVSTVAALAAALAAALPGDTVYVEDDARLDLTGRATLCVPEGVTLASGRGRDGSPGGLLYTLETPASGAALVKACGPDVRITGLRLWGADETQCPPEYAAGTCTGEDRTGGVNCRDCTPTGQGVRLAGHDRLELDNCELAGWSGSAVSVSDSRGSEVHHASLHHTQRQGLGYGVVVGGTTEVDVDIRWNRFDHYRHAVAASGYELQTYDAHHNLALEHTIGHVFDMHGKDEHTHDGSPEAGRRILVHDNSIAPAGQYSFVVRGRPTEGAWFYANCTARAAGEAALQRYFFGNFHVDASPSGAAPNRYARAIASCEARRFCASTGGEGPWRSLASSGVGIAELALADLDGDGKADVFWADGSTWRVSHGGTGSWTVLNTSSARLSSLRLADLDGDGKADVFHPTGSVWQWSRGGTAPWATLRAASEPVAELALGDFDGDGKADVFHATGAQWRWSRSGTAAWAVLNTSSATLDELAFGDFDGDGRTDVFFATGTQWRWSRSGTAPWATLNTSSATTGLAIADLDGDGKGDVFRATATAWLLSSGGNSPWRRLAIASEPLDGLRLGDLDGDGRDDVFRAGCY